MSTAILDEGVSDTNSASSRRNTVSSVNFTRRQRKENGGYALIGTWRLLPDCRLSIHNQNDQRSCRNSTMASRGRAATAIAHGALMTTSWRWAHSDRTRPYHRFSLAPDSSQNRKLGA